MGYYMSVMETNFRIEKNNFDAALKAIKVLDPHGIGGGGCWEEGKVAKQFFSWVDTDEYKNAETLEQAIEAWGWELNVVDGDAINIAFNCEKLGDERYLFAAIAPFVVSGSYIQMRGEDGEIWRWVFDGQKVEERMAQLKFE